jgi:hypothetical protein
MFGQLFATVKICNALILKKMYWVIFWAIFSQTHPVTLVTADIKKMTWIRIQCYVDELKRQRWKKPSRSFFNKPFFSILCETLHPTRYNASGGRSMQQLKDWLQVFLRMAVKWPFLKA